MNTKYYNFIIESLNEKIAQEESLLQGQAQEREQHEKEIIEKGTK